MGQQETSIFTPLTRRMEIIEASIAIAISAFSCASAPQAVVKETPPEDFADTYVFEQEGRIELFEYESKSVGGTRQAMVYLPPSYDENRSYPVLYLLHGSGGTECEWLANGRAKEIFDYLYGSSAAVPMIVVMPNTRADNAVTPESPFDKTVQKAFMNFENDFFKDLIPAIEKRYPTLNDKTHRAVAGLSLGGGHSLWLGTKYMEMFDWIGSFSAGFFIKPDQIITAPAKRSLIPKYIWLSCGDEDQLLDYNKAIAQDLSAKKIPYYWRLDSGAHTWEVWRVDLHLFAKKLFR